MNVAIIILAAGESKRMGFPKQLLKIGEKKLLNHLIDEALKTNCYPISVVVGANKNQIVPLLTDIPINIIDNPFWHKGMGSSIKMGLVGSYMVEKNFDAILVLTSDMPHVDSTVISQLISAAEKSEKTIIASKYDGTIGIPVLFKRSVLEELLELDEENGAKKILLKDKNRVEAIDFEKGKIDLDTPDDYFKFIQSEN